MPCIDAALLNGVARSLKPHGKAFVEGTISRGQSVQPGQRAGYCRHEGSRRPVAPVGRFARQRLRLHRRHAAVVVYAQDGRDADPVVSEPCGANNLLP